MEKSRPTIESPAATGDRSSFSLKHAIVVALLGFVLAVLVQWKTGAWKDDFSATGDETSHFTSAVAMSRYLMSTHILAPYRFASQYYLHYPKVAFGKWPPLFHLLSGIWFLIFPPSRFAAVLFIAVQTAVLGVVAFWVASRLLPHLLASLAAIAVVVSPFFMMHSTIFMTEPQLATLGLLAIMALLNFLEGGSWKSGLAFVIAATACVLTKANGWAVLLSAGAGYLWLRKDTRTSVFQVTVVLLLVVLLCVPFYYFFVRAMSDGNSYSKPTFQFTREVLPTYLKESFYALGAAISVLFLLGILLCFRRGFRQQPHRCAIVLLITWIAGPFVFQLIIPASFEVRHLAIAFPCVVLLAFVAIESLLGRFGQRVVLCAGAATVLLTVPWTMAARYSDLFQIAAPRIVSDLSHSANKAVLISSNGLGEGRMVASMLALDPQTRFICVRATKLLADSNWGASDYHLLARTKEDVLNKLDGVPVSYAAVHEIARRKGLPHWALLREALLSSPERWHISSVINSFSTEEGSETLTIFVNSANLTKAVKQLDVDMRRKLGLIFELQHPGE